MYYKIENIDNEIKIEIEIENIKNYLEAFDFIKKDIEKIKETKLFGNIEDFKSITRNDNFIIII